jgi:hypothetical protein
MRRVLGFAAALALTAPCAARPPSYAEAVVAAEKFSNDPKFRDWADKVLMPMMNDSIGKTILPCFELVPVGESQTARLVLEVRSGQVPRRIFDEIPTPFSKCIAGKMRKAAWPEIPFELKYFPMEWRAGQQEPAPAGHAEEVSNRIRPVSGG